MKIRAGFVSNSSSSSFIMIGECFKDMDAKDILKKFAPKTYESVINKCKEDDTLVLDDELSEAFYELSNEKDGIDVVTDAYDGDIYVGKVLCNFSDSDNETLDVDITDKDVIKTFEDLRAKGIKPRLISLVCGAIGIYSITPL